MIDHFDGREARAYIHADHWDVSRRRASPPSWMCSRGRKALAEYPSYAAIGDILAQARKTTRTLSVSSQPLGTGREIWAILIGSADGRRTSRNSLHFDARR